MPGALLLTLLAAAPSLDHALARYHDLDEVGAERELHDLLETHPPARTAAIAHVYLGILAMEVEFDSTRAEAEFRRAVALEPTVDIPLTAAPKERMIFLRAQRAEIDAETRGPVAQLPAAAVTEAPPRRSHAAAWALGGSGAGAAIAGTVLGVLAAGSDGTTTAARAHDVSYGSYVTGQYEGLSADILWSVGGALVVAAIVVAFTGH
ncbi:MAG TPA: hypothetical protein VMB50_02870 [Myxococcales bacterium]|nr:hypothetical protein [Myxococcales bacterium]